MRSGPAFVARAWRWARAIRLDPTMRRLPSSRPVRSGFSGVIGPCGRPQGLGGRTRDLVSAPRAGTDDADAHWVGRLACGHLLAGLSCAASSRPRTRAQRPVSERLELRAVEAGRLAAGALLRVSRGPLPWALIPLKSARARGVPSSEAVVLCVGDFHVGSSWGVPTGTGKPWNSAHLQNGGRAPPNGGRRRRGKPVLRGRPRTTSAPSGSPPAPWIG